PLLTVQPLGEWNWRAPLDVGVALVTQRLMANPLLATAALTAAALVIVLSMRFARSDDISLRNLLLLVLAVTVIWLLFLVAAYIAVLPSVVAIEAHSTWRYVTQLGPTLTFALFAMIGSKGAAIQGHEGLRAAARSRSISAVATPVIAWLAISAFTL